MSNVKDLFSEISRPGEYVAFLNFVVPTKEGAAYVFMGCDGYSEFAFQMAVFHKVCKLKSYSGKFWPSEA